MVAAAHVSSPGPLEALSLLHPPHHVALAMLTAATTATTPPLPHYAAPSWDLVW